MQDGTVDLGVAAAKATPPVAYLGATFAGLSLPDWAALLAIIYTAGLLLQMGWRFLGWCRRHYCAWQTVRNRDPHEELRGP
jgi:hypothetical protein